MLGDRNQQREDTQAEQGVGGGGICTRGAVRQQGPGHNFPPAVSSPVSPSVPSFPAQRCPHCSPRPRPAPRGAVQTQQRRHSRHAPKHAPPVPSPVHARSSQHGAPELRRGSGPEGRTSPALPQRRSRQPRSPRSSILVLLTCISFSPAISFGQKWHLPRPPPPPPKPPPAVTQLPLSAATAREAAALPAPSRPASPEPGAAPGPP